MKKIRDGISWIQTFSGIAYWPLDPKSCEVEIKDIAHALSMICRFNGHSTYFYSVAQHSVYVCSLISERLYKQYFSDCRAITTTGRTKAMAKINLACKYGLLHDGQEAYINDLPRPIKREIDGYKSIEALNEQAIFEKFGLEYPIPKEIEDLVKWADNVALATEARDLMAPPPQPWTLPEKPDNRIVVPMTQQEAKAKFLEKFYELFEQGE